MIENNDARYDVKCMVCGKVLAENVPFSEAKKVYFEHEQLHLPGRPVRCYPREDKPAVEAGKSRGVA